MMTRKTMVPAIALAAPLLMAPTCVGNETRFQEPTRDTYCFEDVRISAVLSSGASTSVFATALLGMLDVVKGTTLVLDRAELGPGESITLDATIPWSELAKHRGKLFTVVADVGVVDLDKTKPGSTITIAAYDSALHYSTTHLFARATRSFTVCH